MISIMQNRTMDIQVRVTLVWQMAEQMRPNFIPELISTGSAKRGLGETGG